LAVESGARCGWLVTVAGAAEEIVNGCHVTIPHLLRDRQNMKNIFAKPENVLTLCGLALADMALLLSVPQYVPTLHLAKTSFWNGTRINQIRFGSFPDVGLTELARAEAARHAGTWDAWAFACIALQPGDTDKPVLLVDAGEAPVANNVRIVQELRLPNDGFGLYGRPRFSLNVDGNPLPLDEAETTRWLTFLGKGISKLKAAADNWDRWSIPSPDEMALPAPR
jgi:hypothetical protein